MTDKIYMCQCHNGHHFEPIKGSPLYHRAIERETLKGFKDHMWVSDKECYVCQLADLKKHSRTLPTKK